MNVFPESIEKARLLVTTPGDTLLMVVGGSIVTQKTGYGVPHTREKVTLSGGFAEGRAVERIARWIESLDTYCTHVLGWRENGNYKFAVMTIMDTLFEAEICAVTRSQTRIYDFARKEFRPV